VRRPRATLGAPQWRSLPRAGLQPQLVPCASRRQDGHHHRQLPQALPGPCSTAAGPQTPWMTPWATQSGHVPLATHGAAPGLPTRAGDVVNTFRAFACFGCCEDIITAWVGAQNRFFSPKPGGFCTPGHLLGAAALHTGRAATTTAQAAGLLRPVTSSGGAVWRAAWAPVARPRSSQKCGIYPLPEEGGGWQ
jgi:hypothetical protein